jgi:two-component system OmpR family sensor kinase
MEAKSTCAIWYGTSSTTRISRPRHGREVIWRSRFCHAQGRPELLHSAIENVIRNALKHAPESRIVRVETSVDAAKQEYTLRVLDDGRGIPEDELPDLFTPFFRGATARPDGYGLGLAIARRSIEAHGGTIRACNRSGGGLSVEIVLPSSGRKIDDGLGRHP